jgi:hypothetical protein
MKQIFKLLTILLITGLVQAQESVPILIFKEDGYIMSNCINGEKCPYIKNVIYKSNETIKEKTPINSNFLITALGIIVIIFAIIINSIRLSVFPKKGYVIIRP